jgi:hypothetical protein
LYDEFTHVLAVPVRNASIIPHSKLAARQVALDRRLADHNGGTSVNGISAPLSPFGVQMGDELY